MTTYRHLRKAYTGDVYALSDGREIYVPHTQACPRTAIEQAIGEQVQELPLTEGDRE